jgi:ornithine carbamoyltransferase
LFKLLASASLEKPLMALRHFLTLTDLSPQELDALIQRAIVLKDMLKRGEAHEFLRNRVLAMLFEKSSTRTRVSFESAMAHCGGHAIFLSPRDTQLGRGETVEDMARVLSRMVDCIMVRTYAHDTLARFAAYSSVPVINALTDFCHPCQLLADMMTYYEARGSIRGKTVAWVGDGNNMCHSYINAARQFDFKLRIATPPDYAPDAAVVAEAAPQVEVVSDPRAAVVDADLVVTDTWASMGQEDEHAQRLQVFQAYQVNRALMDLAKADALFMHCLPAHRGEEVTDEVIDGAQSVVWQEAENRLHTQKALLELLILNPA